MHLLAAQPGPVDDGKVAVDLGQTPGDIVVLSAADSDIACLAAAQAALAAADRPSLRLASLLRLGHHYSVDRYVDGVAGEARLVVARILGGRGYWPYGVDWLAERARARGALLALLPGDDQPDAELALLSTVPAPALYRLWRYLAEGGSGNAGQFLLYAASLLGHATRWREPAPLLHAGFYWPGQDAPTLDGIRARWQPQAPVAALVFYRALVQAANLAPVDALIDALRARELNPLPLFVSSIKDGQAAAMLADTLAAAAPDIVLNATGFAVSTPGAAHRAGPFEASDCPVLQLIFAGDDATGWRRGTRGLGPRDIAMNVALPEVDGRIITRAVSFKGPPRRDPLTEADIVAYEPVPDRIAFVADLAQRWVKLRRTPPAERRIVLVLANYPNRDARIGNGVGLDTPAATVEILRALAASGYRVTDIPENGDALIARLLAGPTNARPDRPADEIFPRSDYAAYFAGLPHAVQDLVSARWGAPEHDPFFREGRVDCGHFAMPARRFGNVAVAVQPARGYNIDPKASYHDPALVPPHAYLAFYAWIADGMRAHAVVHVGKHGTLEWLPGKALALSAECFPEAALGPLPHFYPFIVTDPGEGTQAKRRAQAVIVDHLTPPLTRAESYGRLAELERLVDEYYAAAGGDPRRVALLRKQILDLMRAEGLDRDCGIDAGDADDDALGKLDAYLCELKEMQIRDGLHVFGRSPTADQLIDLLVALARLGRGGAPHQASLIAALADDLDPGFDPLDDRMLDDSDINRQHNEKMAKRKAARAKILATKTDERGLIIVHTGTGKGKSTAAFGLVMRALGHGMRIGIVQFVKGAWETGERKVLERFPDLVTCRAMGEGFTWETQDRARDIAAARAAWATAKAMIADPAYRMVLLDELNIVLHYDYLPVAEIVDVLKAKPRDLHVIVTGRNAKPELIEIADLVTEMSLVKHPFRSGVKAQAGIEF